MHDAINIWLFEYIRQTLFKRRMFFRKKCIEVLFCFVDHFEPGWGKASIDIQRQRVNYWVENYPKLAGKFRDSDGYMPQHTFFYSPHEICEHLTGLVGLCKHGFGEIELHLHHDHILPFPDTADTLRQKILSAIDLYAQQGIFGIDKITQQRRFGFIHGDWALDNSMGGQYCGVNNELQILIDCGCYADFTFPSLCESQPQKINCIYYAKDDPHRPKSYNTGFEVEKGKYIDDGLMMIQGPLGIRYRRKFPFIAVEAANISSSDLPTRKRINFWVDTAITIKEKPEWVIIKVHTHGAAEKNFHAVLGQAAFEMHAYLEEKFNDGKNFRLHYVTARQLFNIIKAVEMAECRSLSELRDFRILPPRYQ